MSIIMRAMITLAFIVMFSFPINVRARTIDNIGMLVQINSCVDCTGVDQINTAFVFQGISADNTFIYAPDPTAPGFLTTELANIATVVQDNFCVDCTGGQQNNLALVIQNIDPVDGFILSDSTLMFPGLPPTEFHNTVEIAQSNECIDCVDVNQLNFALIAQYISPDNTFIYAPDPTAPGFPATELANIATVVQGNFCVDCTAAQQENLALVIQNVDAASVTPVPEPATALLLGSSLVVFLIFGRRKVLHNRT